MNPLLEAIVDIGRLGQSVEFQMSEEGLKVVVSHISDREFSQTSSINFTYIQSLNPHDQEHTIARRIRANSQCVKDHMMQTEKP